MTDDIGEIKMMRKRWTFVGTVMGVVVTFFAIGALDEMLKVALGGVIGWMAGMIGCALYMRNQRQHHVVDLQEQSRSELLSEAKEIGIVGRASMTKGELAEAIASDGDADDPASSLMRGLVDEAAKRVGNAVGKTRGKVATRNSNGKRS